MRAAKVVWFVLAVLCLVYLGMTSAGLPDYVPIQFDGRGYPVRWFAATYFIGWMVFFLVALNSVFVWLCVYARKVNGVQGINIPWNSYWAATGARRTLLARKLRVFGSAAGIFSNTAWLVGYQTVIERTPRPAVQVLGSTTLSAMLIVMGSLVLVVFAILYFKPPRHR